MKCLGDCLLRMLLVAALCVPLFAAFLLSGAVWLFAGGFEQLIVSPQSARRRHV